MDKENLSDAAAALDWIERENPGYRTMLGVRFFFWSFNLHAINNEKT